jgi:hypothetical protein
MAQSDIRAIMSAVFDEYLLGEDDEEEEEDEADPS